MSPTVGEAGAPVTETPVSVGGVGVGPGPDEPPHPAHRSSVMTVRTAGRVIMILWTRGMTMYMVCQQPSAHKRLCRILSARIMPLRTCLVRSIAVAVCSTVFAAPAAAQEQPAAAATPAWSWMADGSLFATFNDQRSARGERQFRSQNWLMAMATRAAGKGQLTLSGMFSLDPVTVTKRGYSELFQMGEAYQKLENIDRQHPHDLFSQLAVGWRVPMGKASAFTITGAPGHNTRTYTKLSAFLLEALARKGRTSAYTRIELLHVETEHLLFPTVVHRPHPGELIDPLNAYTVGAVRDLPSARWFSVGLGGDVTFYNVPVRLRPFYGDRPVAIHIFARVRPHGGRFMRMWNMTMTEPMRHSGVSMP